MADKTKGKKDAQPKKESKSGEVVVNVAASGESKSNESLLEKDKRGRCDCRLPFTSRGEPKTASPDTPPKSEETSWFTYILWVLLPLLAVGIIGYALYLAIHIANTPQPANRLVQPQSQQGQQPQFLEQLLENDEPVLISSLSDEQLEAILAERRSQRESAGASDGGDDDTDTDSDDTTTDTTAAADDTSNAASAPDTEDASAEDNTELPQAPVEDSADADTDTDTDTDTDDTDTGDSSTDASLVDQGSEAEEHENEETPGAMPLQANSAASTLLQLKNLVHRRAREAQKP